MIPDGDPWDREIELQKAFEMTPTEAMMLASFERGASIREMAERNALSEQTVKNTLSNARRKMKGKNMEIYILKQATSSDGDAVKSYMVNALVRFYAKVADVKTDSMTHIIKVSRIDRSKPGDVQWMNDNVFRIVDLIGNRNSGSPSERASRIADVYNERMADTDGTPKMGHAVVKYWLDKYYVKYDVIEGE